MAIAIQAVFGKRLEYTPRGREVDLTAVPFKELGPNLFLKGTDLS
jgi:hypothetical protein